MTKGIHDEGFKKGLLFVHCTSGNRAAMMMALSQIFSDRTAVDTALQNARQRGLTKSSFEDRIRALAP